MPTIAIRLPKPLEWQQQVKRERKRFNVVAVGRRAGKTTMGIDFVCEPSVMREPVGWFAPNYKSMVEVWQLLVRTLEPITQRVSIQDHRIETVAGGTVELWSLDGKMPARGRKYKRVIVDECAFVPNLVDVWNYAIRPTLADLKGDAYFLSTPKGLNGFWQLFQKAQSEPDWQAWQMSSYVGNVPASEIDDMVRSLPERVVAQEIKAQFLEDGGAVFRNVTEATTGKVKQREPEHQYIMGADFARTNDFTVLSVLDVTDKSMVYLDRFTNVDYATQIDRLTALHNKYQCDAIVAEANNMGGPLVEQMQWAGLPVQPFTTTNATKAQIIQGLALALEQQAVTLLDDATLRNELLAYTIETLPSGLLRYGAPEGLHDDTVMSLALAWYGTTTTGPLLW
jgi:phage FluMu gp28-like protein